MGDHIIKVRVGPKRNVVEIFWKNGHFSRFHSSWLRFNCCCSQCKRAVVGQAKIDRSQFPDDLLISKFEIKECEKKVIFWMNGEIFSDHVTIQDVDFLRNACYCDQCIDQMIKEKKTQYLEPSHNKPPKFDFKNLETDEGMYKFLKMFLDVGFIVIKSVPIDHHRVVKVGELFYTIIESTYGKVYDIFAEESKENISNTTVGLPFHSDQIHYESAPQGQLLHAIKFDDCVEGGYSNLVDMLNVAEILRKESPKDFEILTKIPVVFSTIDYERRDPAHLSVRRTLIEVDYDNQIVAATWNPGTEDTLRVHECDVENFYKAYNKLGRIIQRKELLFHFRLELGDILLFNNQRMIHSRDNFKLNGGQRVLQGVYISMEELRSKYVILSRKLGFGSVAPKLGNKSAI